MSSNVIQPGSVSSQPIQNTSSQVLPPVNPFQVLVDSISEHIVALMGLMAEATNSMEEATNAELNAQKMSNETNEVLVNLQNEINAGGNPSAEASLPTDVVDYINDNQIKIDGVTTGLPVSDPEVTNVSNYSITVDGNKYTMPQKISKYALVNAENITFSGPGVSTTVEKSYGRGGETVTVNGEPVTSGEYSFTVRGDAKHEGATTYSLNSDGSWSASQDFDSGDTDYFSMKGPNGSVTFSGDGKGNYSVDNGVYQSETTDDFTPISYDDTFNAGQLEAIKGEFDVEATSYADSSSQTQMVIQEVAQSFSMAVSEISQLLAKSSQTQQAIVNNLK